MSEPTSLKHRTWNAEFRSTLEVDAMFYAAGQKCLARATRSNPRIAQAEARFAKLTNALETASRGRSARAQMEHESLAIQMESADSVIASAYAPHLENLAGVHIFCAACLEAHINLRARARLKGRIRAEYDRLPLTTKWLYFPALLGLAQFDPGKEPFQDFGRLVSYRNALLHYRGKTEPWRTPNVPSFLTDLGLTEELAGQSLKSTTGMIGSLCERLTEAAPSWLSSHGLGYFGMDFHFTKPGRSGT